VKVAGKVETLKMFVDGRWVNSESGETFEAQSPATGDVIANLPKGHPGRREPRCRGGARGAPGHGRARRPSTGPRCCIGSRM